MYVYIIILYIFYIIVTNMIIVIDYNNYGNTSLVGLLLDFALKEIEKSFQMICCLYITKVHKLFNFYNYFN